MVACDFHGVPLFVVFGHSFYAVGGQRGNLQISQALEKLGVHGTDERVGISAYADAIRVAVCMLKNL